MKYNYIILILISLFFISCRDNTTETRMIPNPYIVTLSKVDKIYLLGKEFSLHKVKAMDLKWQVDSLSEDEKKELYIKSDGDASFLLFIVMGKASSYSITMLNEALALIDPTIYDEVLAQLLTEKLLSSKRLDDETKDDFYGLIEVILSKYPSQINHLKKDNNFAIDLFNDLLSKIDTAKIDLVIDALSLDNLLAWIDWIITNKASAKLIFKNLYQSLKVDTQKIIRSLLVDRLLKVNINEVKDLIRYSDDWGISSGLNSDIYDISITAGTKISGSLLKILALRAAQESLATLNKKPWEGFRDCAQSIKNKLGVVNYTSHIAPPPLPAVRTIKDIVKDALTHLSYEDFTNYYLAIEAPKDVFEAVSKANVSNAKLKELYDLIIIDHPKANALSLFPMRVAPRFLHLLLERPLDKDIYDIADDYLRKYSNYINPDEQPLLNNDNGTGNKRPIQIVSTQPRTVPDNDKEKERIFYRLLENDNGTAVSSLRNNELESWVKRAYDKHVVGAINTPFTNLYNKINDPNQKKFMRSQLLSLGINASSSSLVSFINELVSGHDPFNLKTTLGSDVYDYTHKGKVFTGPMLKILAHMAIEDVANPNAWLDLRNYAEIIKAYLGDVAFDNHILTNNIHNDLRAVLAPMHKENFINYYLYKEEIKDVYDAADRPESEVSNEDLRKLYDLVISNVGDKAMQLSATSNKDILALLVKRSVDSKGDLFYIINSYLNSLTTYNKSSAYETKQVKSKDTSSQRPLSYLLGLRVKKDDIKEKKRICLRLLKNANASAFSGISAKDLGDNLLPLIADNPDSFKKVYGFFPSNSNEAIALRSSLLAWFYHQGSNEVNKWLDSIGQASDPWGLKSSINDEKILYTLNTHEGTLLYVLTKNAIDDQASNPNSYKDLQKFAETMKKHFPSAADFNVFITTHKFNDKPVGGLNETIQGHLRDKLSASDKYFANLYLANGSINDILAAVQESHLTLSNSDLKKLYLNFIGDDATAIMSLANTTSSGSKFIHHLLRRPVDQHSHIILEKFLDDIAKASSAIDRHKQIADNTGGSYPLQLLLVDTRTAADNPIYKAKILTILINTVDDTPLKTIAKKDWAVQRCFFNDDGIDLFKQLYAHASLDPSNRKPLRSALLNEAYINNKLNDFIAKLIDKKDPFGLQSTLSVDKYSLDVDPAIVSSSKHQGSLLYVLTQRFIEKAKIKWESLEDLYKITQQLRSVIETASGVYVNFANMVGNSAIDKLTTYLTPLNLTMLVPYYLSLDKTYVNFDYNLVFDAALDIYDGVGAKKPSKITNKQIAWLYNTAIDNDDAYQLSLLTYSITSDSFLHLLAARTIDTDLNNIVNDLLKRIYDYAETSALGSGDNAVGDYIHQQNSAIKNALALIMEQPGINNKAEAQIMLSNLAIKSLPKTLNAMAPSLIGPLLTVVMDRNLAKLPDTVAKLDNTMIMQFIEWLSTVRSVVSITTNGKIASVEKDHLKDDNVKNVFKDEYKKRAIIGDMANKMANQLVKTVYNNAKPKNSLREALERMTTFIRISQDFLDDTVIISRNFNPFNSSKNTNILYAILAEAKDFRYYENQVKNLATSLESKFASKALWQAYLNDTTSGESIVDLVIRLMKASGNSKFNNADAKSWLNY